MSKLAIRALVAGHAEFAAGVVSAVDMITGKGNMLAPIRVTGMCGSDIEKLLRDTMTATGARVIFTDLHAGSCTMAARRVQHAMPGVVLVAGVNLPLLLDFVLAEGDPHAAAAKAAEKGRASISVHGVTP